MEMDIVVISITILDAAMMVETAVTLLLKPTLNYYHRENISSSTTIKKALTNQGWFFLDTNQHKYQVFHQLVHQHQSLPSPLEKDTIRLLLLEFTMFVRRKCRMVSVAIMNTLPKPKMTNIFTKYINTCYTLSNRRGTRDGFIIDIFDISPKVMLKDPINF